MSGTSRGPGWWRKFRSLPTWVQVASWVGLAVLVIVGSVVGSDQSSGTTPTAVTTQTPTIAASQTPETTPTPTVSPIPSPTTPTASPSATVALTPLPITLTNADFRDGDFSQGLQLGGGAYTLTLTSDKPGPGISVRVYELGRECRGVLGVVGGAGLILPRGDSTVTERQKPLEAGCYSLVLADLLEATVTVKLSR
jgi:hypothetical protein